MRGTNNKTILVVENNELNMKLVKTLLEIDGYQVLTVVDAEKGIQHAFEHRPDLILMDLKPPGMDGLAATDIIKKDTELGQTPVIALTSFAMQGDKDKGLRAGCDGYITKPINTHEFCNRIAQFFNHDD